MKTALFVDCCIRGEASRSRKLAEEFFAHLSGDYTVKRLALMQEELPPLTAERLAQRDALLCAEGRSIPASAMPVSSLRRSLWSWQRPSGISAFRRC